MASRIGAAIALLAALTAVLPASASAQGQSAPRRGVGMALAGGENGVSVARVVAGSPAETAGLKAGDNVVSIAGISILEFQPEQMLALTDTAKSIAIVVMRGEQKLTFTVVPAVINLPVDPTAAPPR